MIRAGFCTSITLLRRCSRAVDEVWRSGRILDGAMFGGEDAFGSSREPRGPLSDVVIA